jgi:hypothetical protein
MRKYWLLRRSSVRPDGWQRHQQQIYHTRGRTAPEEAARRLHAKNPATVAPELQEPILTMKQELEPVEDFRWRHSCVLPGRHPQSQQHPGKVDETIG